jgi:FtsP/CotA-like multicopper oxidase with cupredoxin domain
VLVRFHNDLPQGHVGFGVPQISTHMHNLHTASESDGFPGDFYGTGLFKDHHYINECPGFSQSGGDLGEMLGTNWYHDHRVEFTAQNVYKGLAGFYLMFDSVDTGDETDPSPEALRLPSGEYDVPLQLCDKLFDSSGQVYFDLFNLDGIIGDKFMVNGAIQPFFEVARRKYRFRILDAGPSRFYQLFLSNGQPLIQISSDGNLLPAPISAQSLPLGVSERADVIIDFSSARLGDKIFLQNRLLQADGRGPTGKIVEPGDALLRFDVVRDARDDSRVPATLRTLPPIDLSQVVRERTFVFNRSGGAWTVNGRFFDLERVDAAPRRGTAEIWTLRNGGGGWSHPVHIHFEEFRMLSRNGSNPPPRESGRKDVADLFPDDEVRVLLHFRDFLGRYPMHCHNVVHEDHAMMARWDIVP